MDVDGGWDEPTPEDIPSPGNDAGDAMEVDAEVVREALRTLSAARGHEDGPDGDSAWPGTWPGIWPGTPSETGAGSRGALSVPFAPSLQTLAAAPLQISAPSREPPRVADAAVRSGVRELTIVLDTNALVSRGDRSLSALLDRFGSNPESSGGRAGDDPRRTHLRAVRVRVAVPRRVVQELDGLKSAPSARPACGGGDDDGKNRKVAALARDANRALNARLDAQHRGVDPRVRDSFSSLEVQGPGDAAAARLEMRARGFIVGDARAAPAGDEEILFFCRTRRERGELVAFVTADTNAAVSAVSHASTRDVPVCAFHPERLPVDADEMHAALVAFYEAAAARGAALAADGRGPRPSVAPSAAGREAEGSVGTRVPEPAVPSLSASIAVQRTAGGEGASASAGRDARRAPPEDAKPKPKNHNPAPPDSPTSSPRSHARRALAALDAALPAAVEAMLRDELGDLWAAGVRHDFDAADEEAEKLSADDAFEALRRNRASLAGGAFSKTFGASRGGPDAGREAMRALAKARRARGRHDEARELGTVERATEIVGLTADLLAGCPRALPEVRGAAEAAARAARALARAR